jgi:hypothetical protein
MASAIVLEGTSRRKRHSSGDSTAAGGGCRCSAKPNPRTGKRIKICPVAKTSKHRSGWKITGAC